MWRQVVSQTPQTGTQIDAEHPYAKAAAQLNKLIRSGESLSGNERNCFFMNLRGAGFANASSTTGFDFLDDGRAIVRCDWDFDGDLDFWVANRTAPQLRYLENQAGSKNHFVAFRLRGTVSNRDAIGARVELTLKDSAQRLVQSIRAGEGFLSQSSKNVHFGLGDDPHIVSVAVRWPNGAVERFRPPKRIDAFYEIVEGSGELVAWNPLTVTLSERPNLVTAEASMATANPLVVPFPLPPLQFASNDGTTKDVTQVAAQLLLVNLWAEWCQPCLAELSEWQQHQQELQDAGVSTLALSVDPVEDDSAARLAAYKKQLGDLGIDFEVGIASQSMVEIVQMVHNSIYDHHKRIPVPTTLLLDNDGNLLAIYKGTATVNRILDDVERCRDADANARLPFRGRWIGRLGPYQLSKLTAELWDAGFEDDAAQFADRIGAHSEAEAFKARLVLAHRLKQVDRPREAMNQLAAAHKIQPNDSEVNLQIGIIQAEANRLPVAAGYLLIALENAKEPRAEIHVNLGTVLRRLKRMEDAERHLKRAIELNPKLAAAFHSLGLLQASQNRQEAAVENLAQAVTLDDRNSSFRINYALALAGAKQFKSAIDELDAVLASDPDSVTAWIYKGEVYTQANQLEEAIISLQKVLSTQPKATRVWWQLGRLQERTGRLTEAIQTYRQLSQLSSADHRPAARMAWILATASSAQLRNGKQALKLAQHADALTQSKDPIVLDILAAAYAENGDFKMAMQTSQQAIQLLPDGSEQLRLEMLKHQEAFANGVAFRADTGPGR